MPRPCRERKGDTVVPTVTGTVYVHSKRTKEKRAVLEGVAAEIRRIIGSGEPAVKAVANQDELLPLAA